MPKFTREEVEFIKSNFYNMKIMDIANRLNRPKYSVYSKIRSLGMIKIKKKKWTQDEVDFLKKNCNNYKPSDLAKLMSRDYSSVIRKIRELDILPIRMVLWTKTEDTILNSMAGNYAPIDIAKRLNKSINAVRARAKRLNIKLTQGIMPIAKISKIVGVHPATISRYFKKIPEIRFTGGRIGLYKINPEIDIPKVVNAIMNNNIALNSCRAPLKQLEKAANGEWE